MYQCSLSDLLESYFKTWMMAGIRPPSMTAWICVWVPAVTLEINQQASFWMLVRSCCSKINNEIMTYGQKTFQKISSSVKHRRLLNLPPPLFRRLNPRPNRHQNQFTHHNEFLHSIECAGLEDTLCLLVVTSHDVAQCSERKYGGQCGKINTSLCKSLILVS